MRIKINLWLVIVLCAGSFSSARGVNTFADPPADSAKFICNELLGRPTNNSITVNMCADKDIDAYIEYGTQRSVYTNQTTPSLYPNNIPFNIVINNLSAGSTYFYRVRYRVAGGNSFLARAEHSFNTAKQKGSAFTFAVEADPHMDSNTNPDLYKLTLANVLNNDPDFFIDLGDTFMSEKLKNKTQDSITIRHLLLRSYFDLTCHSVPLYLVIGNHEGECGWELDGTANNLAVMASNTRTKYYPNPLPDNFYSGNNTSEPFVGKRQNYYSWEWGNALFVVIDPYWYTFPKPTSAATNWNWTLGRTQYLWFKSVLENSNAKFKFVFAHQVVGGIDKDGRGGTEAAPFYEMGGKNTDGTSGFLNNRPGWEMPIHQLMVQNHVNIYFHGHDHFYDRQELDGIIYQEVPQPGNPNFTSAQNAASYGYLSGKIIPNTGFLRITVGDSAATVDYIRSYLPSNENAQRKNGMTDYSYVLKYNTPTSVESDFEVPSKFSLEQNYPNPFNPETTIKYSIPNSEYVQLKIFDLLGREIASLVDQYQRPGTYTIPFDAKKYCLSSGIYFYKISAGNFSLIKKMISLK